MALSTEIKALDQELLSHPMRVDLLEAKRDKAAAGGEWTGARVKALRELINRKRRFEAEQAKVAADAVRRETAGSDPLLIRLSERNAALTDELNAMATRLDALHRQQGRAEKLAERILADHQDAESTLETGGLTEGLGQLLLEQRESLPDIQRYRRKARAREQQLAEAGVRRLRHQAEARRIADLEQAVARLEVEFAAEITPQLRDKLRDLLEQRQALLETVLEAEGFYLRELGALDAAERRLLHAAGAYDDFLIEHLFWLRSADPTRLQDLARLPDEARRLLSPGTWAGLAQVFYDQVTHSPAFWLALLVAAGLLWKRRTLVAAIEETAARLGKPSTDSIDYTLRALALTLVAAAPLSLLLGVMGWQLQVAAQGTDLSHAVGSSLLFVALHLYVLRALRMMCLPRGLAAAHFRWPEPGVRLLRVELGRLTWILVSAVLVVVLAEDLNAVESGRHHRQARLSGLFRRAHPAHLPGAPPAAGCAGAAAAASRGRGLSPCLPSLVPAAVGLSRRTGGACPGRLSLLGRHRVFPVPELPVDDRRLDRATRPRTALAAGGPTPPGLRGGLRTSAGGTRGKAGRGVGNRA